MSPYLLVVSIAFLVFTSPFLQAQTVLRLGAHGGYLHSFHNTKQPARVGEDGCGAFTYGTGSGPAFGLTGEVLLTPWLRGGGRLSFARLGATLTTVCDNGIIVPTGKDNEFALLIREYTKHSTLDYGLLELGLRFLPFELPVFLSAGFSIGTPMFGASWEQDERIVSPEGALFPGFVARRSNGGGDFTDTQLRSAVAGGIGYILNFNGNVEVSPELLVSYPLSDATTGYDWKIATIAAGMHISWRIDITPEPESPPPAEPLPPPPPARPRPPVASIGTSTDAAVSITETFVTETFPLLPYIFFEKDSDQLADKYTHGGKTGASSFSERDVPRKTLDIYYHILDIMGSRLAADESIRITLTGSTDDKDSEKGNSSLALRRATSVKNYLLSVWSIDSNRIALTTRSLPSIPSTPLFAEGDEENRRVEITSDSDALFRPIVHERLSEFEITPPVMELSLGADATSVIERWSMRIRHSGEIIAEFGGSGTPPPTLQWRLDDEVAARVSATDKLTATLEITDQQGLSGESAIDIPVRKQQNSFEVGRLSLIVFDFDRSDILPHNQRMIGRFVAEAIKPTSSVIITGSTDKLGEAPHNLTLSAARADNVRRILLSQNPRYEKLEARGIGEAPELYDNALPEGRFYCRTVAVEVSTPVE
jgi:outer membrane protein OmpA-like peptidoglycan-associated protein